MSTLMQDLRYAFRSLRQSPGFAVVCMITLALGIGANTATFTLVDAVMLKSLPVANPKQLYRLGNNGNCCELGGLQDQWGIFSYALYQQFREHTPEFSEMAAFQGGVQHLNVRRGGGFGPAEPYIGEFVSGNYFAMFGVGAFAGRMISPDDDNPGATPVAVISYRAWQQRFGMDPSLVGATLNIDQVPFTVAGIASPGFFGDQVRPDPPDIWLPLATEVVYHGENSWLKSRFHWLYIVGRIKQDADPASIQPRVTGQLQNWLRSQADLTAKDLSEVGKQHIVVAPAGGGVAGIQQDAADGFRLVMTITGVVLLIACANIANLLLARGAAARSETAIRVALGASRLRLIRQVVTESVLLAILGGVAGLLVAFAGTRAILLVAFRGAHFVPISPTPSLAVLGFTFLLSLATGVIFGSAPAWIMSHSDPIEALRGAGRSTRARGSLARRSLVVLQVALSAALLIWAGLLTDSLRNLENQKFGFEPRGRVIVRMNADLHGYKPEKLYALYQQVEQRLTQIPGVVNASYSIYSPMRDEEWGFGIHIQGHPPDEQIYASFDRVSPHYFETIGTRLLSGRPITDQDTPTSPQVAVVNAAFVRKFFVKQNPLGQRFGFGEARNAGDFEIVGVTEDTKYQDARGPAHPTFFLPFLQLQKDPRLSFMMVSHYIGDIELRVAGKPQNLEATVRRTLADIDPNLNVLDVVSLSEQLARNFNQDRLIARLTEIFGLLALTLACVGLYGVTAYSVARRTSEIGIRMAVGADSASVVGLVLRGALMQLGLGLAIGIPAALGGGRLLASQLYGVKTYDPLILAVAAVILAACALVAGFVPARRAASIDPMRALRTE